MENKIHRAVVSAYCTLMLSFAFPTVGDGTLFAGTVNGAQAVEARLRDGLGDLDHAGFARNPDSRPAPAQTAQGAPATDRISVRAMMDIVRATGQPATLDDDFARELGIPLNAGEKAILMKARAAALGEITRQIFVPADNVRECVTLIVDGKNDTRYFLGTADGEFRKAVVNTDDGAIKPITDADVAEKFKYELTFWQARLGAPKVAPAKNPATGG